MGCTMDRRWEERWSGDGNSDERCDVLTFDVSDDSLRFLELMSRSDGQSMGGVDFQTMGGAMVRRY